MRINEVSFSFKAEVLGSSSAAVKAGKIDLAERIVAVKNKKVSTELDALVAERLPLLSVKLKDLPKKEAEKLSVLDQKINAQKNKLIKYNSLILNSGLLKHGEATQESVMSGISNAIRSQAKFEFETEFKSEVQMEETIEQHYICYAGKALEVCIKQLEMDNPSSKGFIKETLRKTDGDIKKDIVEFIMKSKGTELDDSKPAMGKSAYVNLVNGSVSKFEFDRNSSVLSSLKMDRDQVIAYCNDKINEVTNEIVDSLNSEREFFKGISCEVIMAETDKILKKYVQIQAPIERHRIIFLDGSFYLE